MRTRAPLRVGLIGGGSIASRVARAATNGYLPGVQIVGVVGAPNRTSERVKATAETAKAPVLTLAELLQLDPHWVVEAASGSALKAHLHKIAEHPTSLIVMSIGALLETQSWELVAQKRARGERVLLPSGAVAGLDAVAALNALGGLRRAEITTTKSPASLRGAPFLERTDTSLPANEPVTLYEGPAADAVNGFPANVNVAAALSLAGIGPHKTRVRIISDPNISHTRHEIVAVGDAGTVSTTVEAVPDSQNPRSSLLASLSLVATLQDLASGAG